MRLKRSIPERVGYICVLAVLISISFSTLYPFLHVLMYSLSDSRASMSGGLFFIPRNFTLVSYQMVLRTNQIYVAYLNTILRTLVGTVLSLLISSLTAFSLAHRGLRGRNLLSMFIFFTMLFTGGMIPTFLVVQSLGLIDTFWALVLPGMMSAYNMFILRNYFQQLPASMEESASIDGASPPAILFRIILPISKPALAAVAMFYAITYWNDYLDCILYTNKTGLQVLQVYLRNLLASVGAMDSIAGVEGRSTVMLTEETVKMTTIAVSVIPILVVYPFLQRYYTKGITIGAVKG